MLLTFTLALDFVSDVVTDVSDVVSEQVIAQVPFALGHKPDWSRWQGLDKKVVTVAGFGIA